MSTPNINRHRVDHWKDDVYKSVKMYNKWFLQAAPEAFRGSRSAVIKEVEDLFKATGYMNRLTPQDIIDNPRIISTLRMVTAPPIARDRLVGLANVPKSLVQGLEEGRLPARMNDATLHQNLSQIITIIIELLDETLFEWVQTKSPPTSRQIELATVVIGDRRCGAVTDPIIRNAQEARQMATIRRWLAARGYKEDRFASGLSLKNIPSGTFSVHHNVPVQNQAGKTINMPIDVVVQPHKRTASGFPILIEAKSAGDFTNTNKRRKEEATKARQLKRTYGEELDLLLLLCGYFDTGYLGYEAAEGLDWIWEHRVEDLKIAGL